MKRLDAALVELKLAPTRSKAQQMIEAGEVEFNSPSEGWRIVTQSSYSVALPSTENIRITSDGKTLKYVSRGGLKLEGALKHLKLEVHGWRCLDIGISTGGFSDCLLKSGAGAIAGVDVGHDQLASSLQNESKLKLFEKTSVRDLAASAEILQWIAQGVDLCVVDVAFISLRLVLPALATALPRQTQLLALVKPQFEVGPEHLDKHGIVKNADSVADLEVQILHLLEKCGFSKLDYFAADLKGRDGNQEFFVHAVRA